LLEPRLPEDAFEGAGTRSVAERVPHEDALVAGPDRRGAVADAVIGQTPLHRLQVVNGDGEVVAQRRPERVLNEDDMQLRRLPQVE
jgi:hypothetical protein